MVPEKDSGWRRLAGVCLVGCAGVLTCAIAHGAEVPSISGFGKEKFTPWEQVPVSASGRLPTGCPDFEVEPPRATGGPVVKAADFEFSTARDDNALALNQIGRAHV